MIYLFSQVHVALLGSLAGGNCIAIHMDIDIINDVPLEESNRCALTKSELHCVMHVARPAGLQGLVPLHIS